MTLRVLWHLAKAVSFLNFSLFFIEMKFTLYKVHHFKVYILMVFSILTVLHNHWLYPVPNIAQKETPSPSHSHCPSTLPRGNVLMGGLLFLPLQSHSALTGAFCKLSCQPSSVGVPGHSLCICGHPLCYHRRLCLQDLISNRGTSGLWRGIWGVW